MLREGSDTLEMRQLLNLLLVFSSIYFNPCRATARFYHLKIALLQIRIVESYLRPYNATEVACSGICADELSMTVTIP